MSACSPEAYLSSAVIGRLLHCLKGTGQVLAARMAADDRFPGGIRFCVKCVEGQVRGAS